MSFNKNKKVFLILFIAIFGLATVIYLWYSMYFSQSAIEKRINSQASYSILSQNQDISVEFRIPPEYIPRKQGDVYNIHQEIYNDHNTKIYLETVALYLPPKNTRDLFIELKFEHKFNFREGKFVSPYTYNGPNSVGHVIFEPRYFDDNGEEIIINDGHGNSVVFFTPDQISHLKGGLTLKYKGFNLVEYSKK